MNPRTTGLIGAVVGVLAVVSVAVAVRVGDGPRGVGSVVGLDSEVELIEPAKAAPAAELTGIAGWHNSAPLTIESLRGRVVVVDFWTYTCINCRRTFPFLRALQQTYDGDGLTIVGVHTPEFDFEKLSTNVERAVKELDVTWPVAEDPTRATWDAYENQYWPAKYLIDRQGRVRSLHVGEGGDAAVEDSIRTLLAEGGSAGSDRVGDVSTDERPGVRSDDLTPEIYLGAQRGGRFYPPAGPVAPGASVARDDSGDRRDVIYLRGRWLGAIDWVTAAAPSATVDLRFRARDVYVLLAPERGFGSGEVEVLLDGRPVPLGRRGRDLVERGGRTLLLVRDDDLRHALTAAGVGDGHVTLRALTPGVRFVTFTFGG
jgi:thiol-disulfide isomerase/thioredoxin